jgi:branched-chain amino acid transport system permease protein
MKRGLGLIGVAVAIGALAAVPFLAPPFYVNLLVPFFGYAIALARVQPAVRLRRPAVVRSRDVPRARRLWRGVIAGVLGIKHFEAVLVGVALAGFVVALPIGLMCVRYTGIFFGMLTLAFGMLAHSVLLQVLPPDRRRQRHAHPAHAHPGASSLPPTTRSSSWRDRSTTTAWQLLVLACLIMCASCIRPSGCTCGALRDNCAEGRVLWACACASSGWPRSPSPRLWAPSAGAILGFRTGLADPRARLLDALGPPGVS